MTDNQKEAIVKLRHQGHGYATIGNAIGLSKDSVKAYCRAHDLAGNLTGNNARIKLVTDKCLNCGVQFVKISKTPMKKFCCTQCRQAWWNAHREQRPQKATYHFICVACGKKFTAYGNNNRKYCSHQCYIAARFRDGEMS